MSQVRPKGEKVGRHRKEFQVDGLREKLREFFRQEVRAELRAVAALNNVELITALISFNWQLALVGLQLRILNRVVLLLTTEVHNKALAAYLSEQSGASGNLQMTTATLEVLARIAFRQPISQAEIDRLFDAGKRGKLRDLKFNQILKKWTNNCQSLSSSSIAASRHVSALGILISNGSAFSASLVTARISLVTIRWPPWPSSTIIPS
jgi:hypothetical protein